MFSVILTGPTGFNPMLRRGENVFVPEGQHDGSQVRSARTGVWTFTERHVGRFWPEAEGAASRRDDTDRSHARSAWKKRPSKEPSRRVRYDRARLIPDVFLVENVPCF